MTDKQYASISREDGFLLLQKWHDEKRLVRCVAILAPAIEMGAITGRIEQLSKESAYVSGQSCCPEAPDGNSCFLRIPLTSAEYKYCEPAPGDEESEVCQEFGIERITESTLQVLLHFRGIAFGLHVADEAIQLNSERN